MKTWDLLHLEGNMPDGYLLVIGKDKAVAIELESSTVIPLPSHATVRELSQWLISLGVRAHAMEPEATPDVLRPL